ncbi:MAG TPA: hypothetical protein VFW71_07045 [Actinomycetota bacterium]|nr:hypothetical protein [Actinomycetota bacterium]
MTGESSPSPDEVRVQPYYCPYCGEEDFVPSGPLDGPPGEYHCRSCNRRYRVRFLGHGAGAEEGGG